MNGRSSRHPVTVVVPAYGDLPSLVECIRSLFATVTSPADRVLIVNDCGPDVDEIERTVLSMIEGRNGYSYARNAKNLGFVRTCNRAAFELDDSDRDLLFLNSDTVCTSGFVDELSAVLHASPTHGAVCPRSNDATIASLPYALREPTADRSRARTSAVFERLSEILPRFSVSPVAMGFCILVRRDLVRRFGLFDEIYSPGYGEENDFCLRIATEGFASLISHRALVFHLRGRSFGARARNRLRTAHESILVSRYPGYPRSVQNYLYLGRDPVDVFADALVPGDDNVRALIDLEPAGALNHWHEALLQSAHRLADKKGATITVALPDAFVRRTARRFPLLRFIPARSLNGIWDIALACASTESGSQLARLNRCALRWVFDFPPGNAAWPPSAPITVIEPDAGSADATLTALVDEWGRQAVDIAFLRERWAAFSGAPDSAPGSTFPGDAAGRRLVRQLARRLPPPVLSVVARLRGRGDR